MRWLQQVSCMLFLATTVGIVVVCSALTNTRFMTHSTGRHIPEEQRSKKFVKLLHRTFYNCFYKLLLQLYVIRNKSYTVGLTVPST